MNHTKVINQCYIYKCAFDWQKNSVLLVINLNNVLLKDFVSQLIFHLHLITSASDRFRKTCTSGRKSALGVRILIAQSVFINTSLCAGNGVCTVMHLAQELSK